MAIGLIVDNRSPPVGIHMEQDTMSKRSILYEEFLAERAEILRYKWIESQKAGFDIGFEKALIGWSVQHRKHWRASRRVSSQATMNLASASNSNGVAVL